MQLYQLLFPNGKRYIGITSKTAQERFNAHCSQSQNKNPCQHAIHKYGKENVVLTVLATVDSWELLCLAEIEAIEKYQTFGKKGYNLTHGGEGNLTVNVFGKERIERDRERASVYQKAYQKSYQKANKDRMIAYREALKQQHGATETTMATQVRHKKTTK